MENNYSGGMQDIGSMSMGMPQMNNNTQKTQNTRSKVPTAGSQKTVIIAVIAVIILAVAIPFASGKIAESKAKKAVATLSQVVSREKKAKSVDWEKFYPDELAEAFGAVMAELDDIEIDTDAKMHEYNGVIKLSGKENKKLVEEFVLEFAEDMDVDWGKNDIKVSKAYFVLCRCEEYGDEYFSYAVVAKVNGRYGVYLMDGIFY